MNKFLLIIGGLIAALVLAVAIMAMSAVGVYNGIVGKDQAALSKWSQVENQYQRRYDLIPNLVETVKGYTAHEKETLTAVTQARASVGQIKVDASQLPDKAKLDAFAAQQQSLGTALSRLMMIQEKYPELKADEGFRDMRAELAGTENRIAVARMDFNGAVQTYNTTIKTFPNSLLAGMFNFTAKPYFESEASAKTAPKVSFSGGNVNTNK